MKTLTDEERLDWLQLIRTDRVGPIVFNRLLAQHKTAGAALRALPDIARQSGRKKPLIAADRAAAEQELAATLEAGARLIARCEPDYPQMLAAIADPPPMICVQGHPILFDKPAIAIIGARNASAVGRKMARMLAGELSTAGVVVVSGLARGIDGAAHEAALGGGTIAVVAGGLDVIYPPEHFELTRRIGAEGVLLSERPIGLRPTARDFPRRNRLISGLSKGVIVVEAAARSGTLITARFALEQGREVFAVPGSPLDPRCQGANALIRDGAHLVENVETVLDVLNEQSRGLSAKSGNDLFDLAGLHKDGADQPKGASEDLIEKVAGILSYTPLHRDDIIRECGEPPGLVLDALLTLILSGRADEHPGGAVSKSSRSD